MHEVDVIVYATGFHATEYLYPMTITGRGGQTLEELWAEGWGSRLPRLHDAGLSRISGRSTARTPTAASPSATFHEMVAHYALQCMETLVLGNGSAMEVRPDAYLALQPPGGRAQPHQGVERPARPQLLLDRARPLGHDEPVLHRRDVRLPAQTRPRRPGDRLMAGGDLNFDEQ